MASNDSVQPTGMQRLRDVLLNDKQRLENEVLQIKQKLAELEAAIYLEAQKNKERESGQNSASANRLAAQPHNGSADARHLLQPA